MTGKSAYYNEHDPQAAAWLRELIRQGHIASGEVDERSIEDVFPADLAGFGQCHFFAGIGVWSYAIRRAGIPDDCPIWTGSCPCQPFSAAGKGKGFADERHLWPAFFHLIEQCQPFAVLGEQVADRGGAAWIDLVQTDMEGLGYAFGACVAPSAGFGAPIIRHRTYWCALDGTSGIGREWREGAADWRQPHGHNAGWQQSFDAASCVGQTGAGALDGTASARRAWSVGAAEGDPRHQARMRVSDAGREAGGLAVPDNAGSQGRAGMPERPAEWAARAGGMAGGQSERPGPTNGQWADADWLFCRDGRWRPVEPGTFPLAHGPAAAVGRLRGYGNAINAAHATAFVEAVMVAA